MSCKWQTNLYALPACIEGPTLFGGIIMSNDYVFNTTLPVAPLKIAALRAADLAESQLHIINFRRNDIEVLKNVRKICSTAAMMLIPTCLTARARVSKR